MLRPAMSAASAPTAEPEMMSALKSWRRSWACRRPRSGAAGTNASVSTSVETLRLAAESADVAFVLKLASLPTGQPHYAPNS
jgi:hypothetical protein